MDKKDNLSPGNRESARIPDSFTVNYKIINQKEFEKKAPFYINRKTSNRPFGMGYDTDIFSFDWSSLENEADYNPFLAKVLSSMDKKLDLIFHRQENILKTLAHKDPKQEVYESGECIDLSGSGISMLINKKIKKDSILEVSIEPAIYPPVHIVALGEITRIFPTKNKEKSGYEVSVTFTTINETDREELIKYVFKRQRELILSQKSGDDCT